MPSKSILTKLVVPEAVVIQSLPLPEFERKQISVDILRLDRLHPVISGNKYFKLKYAVLKTLDAHNKGIISFGGAYSNHLVALACVCKNAGLLSVGVVRGEKPATLSPTLQDAVAYGMELRFVSRQEYNMKQTTTDQASKDFPEFSVIPEGGQSEEGVAGAAEILSLADSERYDVIACSVGTGTTMAGLIRSAHPHQKLIGFSSLRLTSPNEIDSFIQSQASSKNFSLIYDYHFGGYAKKTEALISFMNEMWSGYLLPTDFVYTAKMFYGLRDLAGKDYFKAGTKLLAIHSGGLQGNRSISSQLIF